MIRRVEDYSGDVLYENRAETYEVMDERIAYLITDTMRSVMEWGTGKTARRLGLRAEAAGKTGTTDDYTDAWFVGYTSSLLAGVWVGFDLKEPIGDRMTGAVCALPVWTRIMTAAARQEPTEPFRVPSGIIRARVCRESGQLATEACPETTEEVFIEGTEPPGGCLLHE